MILIGLAALAVLVGVVYVVLGKGGQLARYEADFPPLDLPDGRPVRAFELGGLMVPLSLWGYHVRAVDELLVRLAGTLQEREEHIADLEWRLSLLDPSYVPEGTGPDAGTRVPGDPEPTAAEERSSTAEAPSESETADIPGENERTEPEMSAGGANRSNSA